MSDFGSALGAGVRERRVGPAASIAGSVRVAVECGRDLLVADEPGFLEELAVAFELGAQVGVGDGCRRRRPDSREKVLTSQFLPGR